MLREMALAKRQHGALDTLHQVLLSLYDQLLFGADTADRIRSSVLRAQQQQQQQQHDKVMTEKEEEKEEKDLSGGAAVASAVEEVASLALALHGEVMPECMPAARGSHWFARMGHLTTYGATYYGYLYDKVRLPFSCQCQQHHLRHHNYHRTPPPSF